MASHGCCHALPFTLPTLLNRLFKKPRWMCLSFIFWSCLPQTPSWSGAYPHLEFERWPFPSSSFFSHAANSSTPTLWPSSVLFFLSGILWGRPWAPSPWAVSVTSFTTLYLKHCFALSNLEFPWDQRSCLTHERTNVKIFKYVTVKKIW